MMKKTSFIKLSDHFSYYSEANDFQLLWYVGTYIQWLQILTYPCIKFVVI